MSGSSARPLSSTPALASLSLARRMPCARLRWWRSSRRFRARRDAPAWRAWRNSRRRQSPTKPGSPPARSAMARSTAQASASVAPIAPWQLWLKWSYEPLRLIAPTLGLKPTAPQKLDGRRIEPTTWVPSPAGTMPAPTAAAEPLDEPPGVRAGVVRVLRLVPRVGGGEFGGRGLADDDGAGLAQRVHARRIAARFLALPQRRALAGRHVGGLDDVLDRDRHAVDRRQRLAVAPARGRGVGGLDRAVLVQLDEGADGGIELGDALEASRRDRRAAWSCRRAGRPPAPHSRAACWPLPCSWPHRRRFDLHAARAPHQIKLHVHILRRAIGIGLRAHPDHAIAQPPLQ